VRAILSIIDHYNIPTEGKYVCILGRSELVGKPLATILSSPEWNATVTLCHSKSNYLDFHIGLTDIVISAMGLPHKIPSSSLLPNLVVIDAGISKTPEGIKGDVKWNNNIQAQTPVPGGVGPVTVACLLENVVLRWSYSNGL
jgi:methylenetetrahydrofolate dehydrogenase (NADP+)/methenyltetrahydrofolate cyclohydrolase